MSEGFCTYDVAGARWLAAGQRRQSRRGRVIVSENHLGRPFSPEPELPALGEIGGGGSASPKQSTLRQRIRRHGRRGAKQAVRGPPSASRTVHLPQENKTGDSIFITITFLFLLTVASAIVRRDHFQVLRLDVAGI